MTGQRNAGNPFYQFDLVYSDNSIRNKIRSEHNRESLSLQLLARHGAVGAVDATPWVWPPAPWTRPAAAGAGAGRRAARRMDRLLTSL
jgi:hypothetical protein